MQRDGSICPVIVDIVNYGRVETANLTFALSGKTQRVAVVDDGFADRAVQDREAPACPAVVVQAGAWRSHTLGSAASSRALRSRARSTPGIEVTVIGKPLQRSTSAYS